MDINYKLTMYYYLFLCFMIHIVYVFYKNFNFGSELPILYTLYSSAR